MKIDIEMLVRVLLYVAVFLVGAAPGDAQAYIDPGVGSMVLQLLLGGVAGLLVILKLYWSNFKALFQRRKGVTAEPSEPSEPRSE